MRKFVIVLTFVFLLSGCGAEETAMTNQEETKKQEEDKKQEEPIKEEKVITQERTLSNDQVQHEDLFTQYDQAIIKTNYGDIKVKFYKESPVTVNNFLNLSKKGFYDNTKFHRVMKDFMIQGGDPLSRDDDWSDDGTGGPGYKFQDEINDHKLVRGNLAMANSGPNTNGSQFFIVTKEATPWLDSKHTNFGYVIEGMEIVEKIEAVEVNERDHPVEDVVVEEIELINSEQ